MSSIAMLDADALTVRLPYRPPYGWAAVLAHLRARAIEGVERVGSDVYARTFVQDGRAGLVEIRHLPDAACIETTVRAPPATALPPVLARVRRVFDLDADVAAIGAHLARDPMLAPLVAARPGLRVPGGWDGFELAARAVLGQQVTVGAARRLLGQLARIYGTKVRGEGGLAFPAAEGVADADLSALGTPDETLARLRAIAGIGDWTAHYIALRAARDPDAFPASDVGLLRGAARGAARPTPMELAARAERWRPWRAYAAQHLWTHDALPEETDHA